MLYSTGCLRAWQNIGRFWRNNAPYLRWRTHDLRLFKYRTKLDNELCAKAVNTYATDKEKNHATSFVCDFPVRRNSWDGSKSLSILTISYWRVGLFLYTIMEFDSCRLLMWTLCSVRFKTCLINCARSCKPIRRMALSHSRSKTFHRSRLISIILVFTQIWLCASRIHTLCLEFVSV